MKRDWIFSYNTFEVNTRRRHRVALSLFENTYAKLKEAAATDAVMLTIFNGFKPYFEAYRDLYALKQAGDGLYEGQTLGFTKVLAEMKLQLRTWEAAVRVVYTEDTPEEHMIFPNKRTPFLIGTYEERISMVETLGKTLAGFPALASTQTLVITYYNRLQGARLLQQQKEGNSTNLASLLESQRIITANELYGVLAQLMFHFRTQRVFIKNFFDLGLLRIDVKAHKTTQFSGSVVNANTGAPIAGALVKILETQTEISTNAEGKFTLVIKTGIYTLLVSAPGFNSLQQNKVMFRADKKKVLNFVLQV